MPSCSGVSRQAPVVERHARLRQREDALPVHAEHLEGLGRPSARAVPEAHEVVGHVLAGQQPRRVGLVPAHLERHRHGADVLHRMRLHDGAALEREVDGQAEVEGVDRPRLRVGDGGEAHLHRRYPLGGERPVAAEAVHRRVHARAAVRVPAVAQAPDQRKQQRRAPSPHRRVAAPHALDAVAHDALQLRARARDAHCELVVSQLEHSRLPHSASFLQRDSIGNILPYRQRLMKGPSHGEAGYRSARNTPSASCKTSLFARFAVFPTKMLDIRIAGVQYCGCFAASPSPARWTEP